MLGKVPLHLDSRSQVTSENKLCYLTFQALFEGHLVELPLASFFLSKLLGQQTVNVDIDHLSSLDPELYRNLLYLKVSQLLEAAIT
jgi:hypothetical protein